MNKLTTITIAGVFSIISTSVLAAPKADLNVSSNNNRAATQATGKKSLASTGSINLKKAVLRNTRIDVRSANERSRTVARGKNSKAATGSAVAKRIQIKNAIIHVSSINRSALSVARGKKSTATTGSIILH